VVVAYANAHRDLSGGGLGGGPSPLYDKNQKAFQMSFFICCASQTLALHHILKCLHALCLSTRTSWRKRKGRQDEGLGQTTFACIERRTHTNMLMLLFRASFKILLIFAYLFHFPPFFLCVLNVSQFPPFGHIVLSIHSTCSYHKKRHFESFVPKNPKKKLKKTGVGVMGCVHSRAAF